MGLSEKLLNLGGYEIWPPNSGDPRIKGPQPRIITKRQKEWIEKIQRENPSDGVDSVVRNEGKE
jgi:hypothetical protein